MSQRLIFAFCGKASDNLKGSEVQHGTTSLRKAGSELILVVPTCALAVLKREDHQFKALHCTVYFKPAWETQLDPFSKIGCG